MIYLDLETTGLSITQDRIVQIGCIRDGVEKKMLINPGIPIPPEATAIHGITDEMVKDANPFKMIAKGLWDYLYGHDLAGYNSSSYDLPLLMEEFARVGMEMSFEGIQIHDVYRNECKINPRNLSAVYKRLTGEELDSAHDALADTRATKIIHELQLEMDNIDEILSDPEGIEYLDFTQKLYRNKDGVVVWAFGKNKDRPIKEDRNYCNWALRSEFTKQVKDIISQEING